MENELEEVDILSKKCERAILISIQTPDISPHEAEQHLIELEGLVDTMGIEAVDSIIVKIKAPKPKYFIGSGKLEEIVELAGNHEADILIFDEDLSPSQQRNIEREASITVIDRHEVILDIFSDRASTREAVLQVALARMEYSLPRLTRAWTHLSRQRGGAKGNRGEGETQLEVDRRLVLKKIDRIKKELVKVRKNRATQRKKRQSVPVPTASIVGYTNAGKSSLLNAATHSDTFVEDKLFATLDPTTRKVILASGQDLLLTDTVGFIRRLPHDLVDAFKSTLEETVCADFLVHVLDCTSPEVEVHHETTLQVLDELGVKDKTTITVFNKIDLLDKNAPELMYLAKRFDDAIFISTKTGEGIEELFAKLDELVQRDYLTTTFEIPHNNYEAVAYIHRTGNVISEDYQDHHVEICALVPIKTKHKLEEYVIK